ncbi:MAG: hypothetical protein JWN48_610 [Myxococcaceae bacterium]|nr:hypothetical protein [Myxococcaceae bacterium]
MKVRPSWLGWAAFVLLSGPLASQRARAQNVSEPTAPTPSPPAPAGGADTDLGECVGDRFIVLSERGFAPELGAEVRTDFATELSHRGLSLCEPSSTTREPAAVVDLQADDGKVVIQLDDRVTHKRVARDLSLHGIPANGRALAIAIAIDELLRASWAELTLRPPHEHDEDEQDSATRVLETRTVSARGRATPRTRFHLGIDLGYLHTAHDFDAFALDLRASVRPWGWAWFELGLGGFGSVPAHGSQGDALAAGFRSLFTAGACARPRGAVFGCGGVRGELDAVRLRGAHAVMAQSRRQSAILVQSSLVGLLAVTLQDQAYLFGEFGLGALVQGAEATNGTRTLMGITGMVFSLSLGVGYDL